jgi:diacylglycerol kinase
MRLIKSFGYAGQGIRYCWQEGPNFRIHVLATVIVICLAVFLGCTPTEWMLLIVNMVLVISFEMFNTALEKLCDVVSPFTNPKVKIIKDAAAGAVLVAAIGSMFTGAFIFIPKIIHLF